MYERKRACLFAIVLTAVALFNSCGLEDSYFLPPIPQNSVTTPDIYGATINIPTAYSSYAYFTNFQIFYRIYISGEVPAGKLDTDEVRRRVNTVLASNYNAIEPSTNTTSTTVNTSIGSLFSGQKFYELGLEGAGIGGVLDLSCLGSTVTLDFSSDGSIPSMTVGTTEYPLFRSNGGNVFNPEPDRYFRNTSEICLSENTVTTQNINNDVADANANTAATPRYTYVSMYIVAAGIHPANITTIYSSPTFLGFFSLPGSN